jgi:CpXC protein
MTITRVNCPACKQPISADIDQLFDAGQDPAAKQKLLSGMANFIRCPNCGYQGSIATPIVYHDPEKELLLTYFPVELSLPRNEQERLIGSMINRVTNSLPQEKRKAYLLRPQTMLTMQSLAEKILDADGITKEMIQAQQQRLRLLQDLMSASKESFVELATKEDELIDETFFSLASSLIQAALAGGDQASARRLSDIQKELLPITTYGRELQAQSEEINAAIRSLQEAGESLTREKLLELVINAPSETQLNVIASLARQGLDYEFFRLLSDRIDRARGEGRNRLVELRKNLLEITQEIDKQIEARGVQALQLLNTILQSENVRESTISYLPAIDEFFSQALGATLEKARSDGDLEKINKLKIVEEVLQEASSAPPEIALIEEFLRASNDEQMQEMVESHKEEITSEFLDVLSNVVAQAQSSDDMRMVDRIQALYRMAIRASMEKNF